MKLNKPMWAYVTKDNQIATTPMGRQLVESSKKGLIGVWGKPEDWNNGFRIAKIVVKEVE